MVFSSLVFLCIFLPAVLLLHTLVRNRSLQNALLLAASLLFYAYGEPVYVLLMLASTLFNYAYTLFLAKHRSKPALAVAVAVNLALLGVFKYAGFAVENVNGLFRCALPVPAISLPIGISFFTFQALSYVIDVYRQQVPVQRSYGKLLLYISFFPQLIAGPIVRYSDVARQIDERSVSLEGIAYGLRRFIAGLGKKVLIAGAMGAVADAVFGHGTAQLNVLSAWTGAVAYLMQIYFDFSGYSDMAIGLGKMFGFRFLENFNYPYVSGTVQEFWRRWHISLSSFFRDYVYIPLGGNRKGRARTVLNRLTVFFLTGLWHGASWTFVLWGLFHGFFLLLEAFVPQIRKLPKLLGHLYTLLTVTVGFVLFRADTVGQAGMFMGKMFSGFDFSPAAMSFALQQLTPYFLVMLVAAVVCCGPLAQIAERVRALEKKTALTAGEKTVQTVSFVLSGLLLLWCMLRLAGGSYNPFIYFKF